MHTLALKTALLGCAAAAFAAPAMADTLVIRDFVGRVEVVTGPSAAFDIEVIEGAAGRAPQVDRRGDRIVVEGDLDYDRGGWWGWNNDGWRGGLGCRGDRGDREVRLERRGDYHRFSELPLLRVTAPADVHVQIERSLIDGAASTIGSGEIGLVSCASFDVADVRGALTAAVAGSGDLSVGHVGGTLQANIAGSGSMLVGGVGGAIDANIAGSGDLRAGAVQGGAHLNIAGSGDLVLASVAGPVEGNIAGSGNMTIEGGRSERLSLSIMGSGGMIHSGATGRADVSVFGSGDVDIATADDSDVNVAGSGDVRVNGVRVR